MPTPVLVLMCIVAMLAVIGAFITKWIRMANEQERLSSPHKDLDHDLVRENRALREQLDKVYDRLETLERIVTDKPSRLSEEIDRLGTLPPRPPKVEEAPETGREEKE